MYKCFKCGADTTNDTTICCDCTAEMYGFEEEKENISFKYDSVVHFEQLTSIMCDTYKRKNNDYGNSFTKTYEEFGNTMSIIRLQDKLERFKRLSKATQEVKDESIIDTLLDLANYSIMTVMELQKNK